MGTLPSLSETRQRLFALKQAGPLRYTSNSVLLQLLESAQELTWEEGQQVCQEGQPFDGFFLLSDGILEARRDGLVLLQLRAGQVLGVESVVRGIASATVTAISRARALFFPREAVLNLAEARAGLRQDLGLDLLGSEGGRQHSVDQRAEVVAFSTAPELRGVPLSLLVGLLAKVQVRDFGDRLLLLKQGAQAAPPVLGADGVYSATVPADVTEQQVREFVLSHTGEARFDYVFLDGLEPPGLEQDKTVRLVDRPPATNAPTARVRPLLRSLAHRTLPTVLVHPRRPPEEQELCGRHLRDNGDAGLEPELLAPVWVRLDWDELERKAPVGDAPLEALGLNAGTLDSLARWARAVTHRRVGVALSGGGVWGFYHVHVLRWMVRRGIPIDMVSSASMGSAVGGYFCGTALDGANGLGGLDLLVDQAMSRRITAAALASVITTRALQWRVERDLGNVALGSLTTRFLPVASDLTTGLCTAMEEGPLALAVRASSSAPGIWAPTLLPPARYVDGAFTSNVPAEALLRAGADLTFAGNIFPFGHSSRQPLFPGTIGRFIAALNPLERALDLVASGVLLLHNSGEVGTQQSDVGFDILSRSEPLLTAMEFTRARDIITQAEQDPVLEAKLEELAAHWEKLQRRSKLPEGAAGRRAA
ncbi:cyclic nucleotide-binding protein [Corallococcus sp. H22C18031201]|nr:cyclic nucleotide-binding protein [Corallococcus sp. H22C18031201]